MYRSDIRVLYIASGFLLSSFNKAIINERCLFGQFSVLIDIGLPIFDLK